MVANCWLTVETWYPSVVNFFSSFIRFFVVWKRLRSIQSQKKITEKGQNDKKREFADYRISVRCKLVTNTTNSKQFIFLSLFRSLKSACVLSIRFDSIRWHSILTIFFFLFCYTWLVLWIVNLLLVWPYFVNVFSFQCSVLDHSQNA